MTKVYPNASVCSTSTAPTGQSSTGPVGLTVWKKSMLMNCNGFTVFDTKGNLVFRVDNYIAGNKAEILLMDAAGKPLLTLRRKRLSLGDSWLVYDGETRANPRFCVRKHVNILNRRPCLALVSSAAGCGNDAPINNKKKNDAVYEIEGSYAQRSCTVYDSNKRSSRPVAEIKRKEPVGGVAFGVDVFRLLVQPDRIDTALAMSLVILLDQMFGSSSFSKF